MFQLPKCCSLICTHTFYFLSGHLLAPPPILDPVLHGHGPDLPHTAPTLVALPGTAPSQAVDPGTVSPNVLAGRFLGSHSEPP